MNGMMMTWAKSGHTRSIEVALLIPHQVWHAQEDQALLPMAGSSV